VILVLFTVPCVASTWYIVVHPKWTCVGVLIAGVVVILIVSFVIWRIYFVKGEWSRPFVK